MIARADRQVFGQDGVVSETRATVVQLGGLLADARNSLKKVDAVLVEAQAIGANTREATSDLGGLRAGGELAGLPRGALEQLAGPRQGLGFQHGRDADQHGGACGR